MKNNALLMSCIVLLCFVQQGVAQCPKITGISTNAMSCATGDEPFILNPTIFPLDPGDYTYQWTGPNGYTSNAAVAMLPNNNAADNGTYTLVVTNAMNCSSDPEVIPINITDRPPQPVIAGDAILCVGEALLLSIDNISAYDGLNVQYQWSTPFGDITTTTPRLSFLSTTTDFSFNYNVIVMLDGTCPSEVSVDYPVVINTIPGRPSIQPIQAVCFGDTINLAIENPDNMMYQWLGPNGLDTMTTSLVIDNATNNYEGEYQVRAIRNTCVSAYSSPVTVQVNDTPEAPIVNSVDPLCLNSGANVLDLSISDATYNAAFEYIWVDSISGDTVAGPTNNQVGSVVDFSAYANGSFSFFAFAKLDGCTSDTSNTTTVQINSEGLAARAGEDQRICNVTSISLSANVSTEGFAEWSQLEGPIVAIDDKTNPATSIDNLRAGENYKFKWAFTNGICGEYSSDTVNVFIGSSDDIALATDSITACDSNSVNLRATAAATGNVGIWSQSTEQQGMGVSIIAPNDPLSKVAGLIPGESYLFTWSLSNDACGTFSSINTRVIISDSRQGADAGDDQNVCGDPTAILMGNDAEGQWTSDDSNVIIAAAEMPDTEVSQLNIGENRFTWTAQNGACGITSDELIIRFEEAVNAIDDNTEIKFTEDIEIDVLANDVISDIVEVTIKTLPARGRVTVSNNIITYAPDAGYKGTDEFIYEICNATCPDICDVGIVKVEVDNLFSCTIPTIFTPNNDGVNDEFKILCLEEGGPYGNNSVRIYNQWGDEVFRAAPYGNNWQGTFDGQNLPSGTYYYIVDFGDGQVPSSGFVMLER